MTGACLNEYHLQFLKLLVERDFCILLIGGQARAVYNGMRTRDLDVGVDVSHSNKPIAGQCISAWVARYPLHAPFLQRPVSLRSGQPIKFPDADVFFFGTDELP